MLTFPVCALALVNVKKQKNNNKEYNLIVFLLSFCTKLINCFLFFINTQLFGLFSFLLRVGMSGNSYKTHS
ncbi:hypothetical protein BACOVA_03126 [Bacteroides ovatus ATCC 8483]|uniref:Uncharacterized protein n=1 Tax=Bacteroides ovatus (strain ATCC 8483 / DSM 1896 / JCM 5824 / BCRC 10623 / CCUG 4943 / NCTC 11153) TaxID=411476 RepID=A0AAN3D921_BACO1|nr:hypothetical protein BACOVA_03126 [Bacteroides ovatus ATCC 8483]